MVGLKPVLALTAHRPLHSDSQPTDTTRWSWDFGLGLGPSHTLYILEMMSPEGLIQSERK